MYKEPADNVMLALTKDALRRLKELDKIFTETNKQAMTIRITNYMDLLDSAHIHRYYQQQLLFLQGEVASMKPVIESVEHIIRQQSIAYQRPRKEHGPVTEDDPSVQDTPLPADTPRQEETNTETEDS